MDGQVATGEPVIGAQQDLADALAGHFLSNAAAGDNATNDDFVAALRYWKRQQQTTTTSYSPAGGQVSTP